MKKAVLIILAILVLVVGGLSAYVAMIDWNEHKDKIAEQFSDVSGKLVVFEGPVSFKIFPSPDLTASNIKVYSKEAGKQDVPLATIDRLVAKLSLWPLLKGNFEVQMMSLIGPKILMEIDDEGKLNWQSAITPEQKLNLDNVDIKLDSVLLEKATLNVVSTKHDIDINLENLNAEVIAPSIFGPYRIEGSYVKDNNPEGFAMSLGRFSETFATSVNFVLNHPTSETFVRFDGSVLLKNEAINGDVIIESKKPVDFINKNFKDIQLGNEYNYPLALSLQTEINKTKISFSNIVVKYGSTAGAGNILVPLAPDYATEEAENERKRAEIGFEMTDLDLTPVEAALKSFYAKYSQKGVAYNPQLKFDFIADVKSINTQYNGQTFKDFNLSVDYLDNELEIRNLSATLPGETEFKMSGEVFADNDLFTYNLKPEYTTNDLQKLLAWLGYEVKPITQATYKKSFGNATVAGNFETLSVAPFEINVDKNLFAGNMGFVIGERPNAFLDVSTDSINFDNYVPSLPEEEKQKSFTDRLYYRASKLGFLNDFDFRFIINIGLGIYEGIPFENAYFDVEGTKGEFNILNIDVGTVANASFNVDGKVKGLGNGKLSFENMKYNFNTKDLPSFLNKFELALPKVDLKKLKNFSSRGIMTGTPVLLAIKAVSKWEYMDVIYAGQLNKRDGKWSLAGKVNAKAPDFVQMVNDFGFNYKPKAFSLGMFTLTADVLGGADYYSLTNISSFVGSNNFSGYLTLDTQTDRPKIDTQMDISRLELERFWYNDVPEVKNSVSFRNNEGNDVAFVAKPDLDKTKINYDFYKKFDLSGKFNIGMLSYKNHNFANANIDFALKDAIWNVNNFDADYDGGKLVSNWSLDFVETPKINGKLSLNNQKMSEKTWSGSKYGIKSGTLDVQTTFNTSAASVEEMLSAFEGEIDYKVSSPVFKGWDLAAIDVDLRNRDHSDGLVTFVQENLQKGETAFDSASGKIKISKADYVFENAVLNAKEWSITMLDKGNLNLWDMNADFKVTLDNDKIKPFSFALKGPMSEPELSVNVKDITDTYDAHWAKVAADKKAAEDARKAQLKALMDEQQAYAKKTQQRLFKEVIPELEARRKLTQDKDILARYQKVDDVVKEVSKGLDEIFVQGAIPEFDESLPKALGEKNIALDDKSVNLKDEILRIYEQDIKLKINGFYNKIVDNYNQSKIDANDYRDNYGVFAQRLAAIKTMLDIERDDKVIALKKEIEDQLLALDAINSQAVKDYIFMQNSHDLKQLEDYVGKISDMEKKSVQELKLLNEKIDELFKYSEEITKKEENAYAEKLKQEEIKKKLEENTGKISGASGKDITVTRNIQEIEALEKAKENEEIPVLDFSGKQPSGIVSTPVVVLEEEGEKVWQKAEPVERTLPETKEESMSSENEAEKSVPEEKVEPEPQQVPENQDVLLREIVGDVAKASGKIIRVGN